jgi:ABC-2 type transport system ATP-binding protein
VNGEVLTPAQRRDALFYMPDGITPWPDQTVGWVLSFSAAAQGGQADAVPDARRQLALENLQHRRVGTLSKGQRRRLLLALALLTPQPLLLLDEPFDGLDLRQTRDVSALLRRVAASGRTLLLSIHQLSDAMKVCDRLVLLSDGLVVGEGTLAELQAHAGLPQASIE